MSMSGKRWSERHDRFLAFYGPAIGYDFVASHDLGRPAGAGVRRIRWLRKHKPELVAEEVAKMAREPEEDERERRRAAKQRKPA